MKASDLFGKALEREGVEYVFGIPGEEGIKRRLFALASPSFKTNFPRNAR